MSLVCLDQARLTEPFRHKPFSGLRRIVFQSLQDHQRRLTKTISETCTHMFELKRTEALAKGKPLSTFIRSKLFGTAHTA